MQVELLTFCATTQEYPGAVSILGMTDSLGTNRLPVSLKGIKIATKIRFDREEEGTHDFAFRVTDEDGRAQFDLYFSPIVQLEENTTVALNITYSISNELLLHRFGEYSLMLLEKGRIIWSTPFTVRQGGTPLEFPSQ